MICDLSALDKMTERFLRLVDPDAKLLMKTWMDIIEQDNRKGVLAGLDKDGNPMAPVTYRPVAPSRRLTRAQKNNPKKGARVGVFLGFGPAPSGLNNNLTSAEYRRLDGPPLAPRRGFSRVVTNLKTTWHRNGPVWTAVGLWDEVVSRKGKKFLRYLFNGQGRFGSIPARDLRGVRPAAQEKARRAARAWMIDQIRTYG